MAVRAAVTGVARLARVKPAFNARSGHTVARPRSITITHPTSCQPSVFSPFKSSTLDASELELLRTFSCRNARAFKPADRATVLAAIREHWGSEDAFDAFVRTELPLVLT